MSLVGLVMVSLIAPVAGGCATSRAFDADRHEPGPGAAPYRPLPTTLTPSQLAYGRPTGNHRVGVDVDLDPYLKPASRRRAQAAKPARPARRIHTTAPAAPPAPETAAPAPVIVAAAERTRANPELPADAQRYAAREAQANEQMKYRGGDVVVISVSTLLIILLVVILILLLV